MKKKIEFRRVMMSARYGMTKKDLEWYGAGAWIGNGDSWEHADDCVLNFVGADGKWTSVTNGDWVVRDENGGLHGFYSLDDLDDKFKVMSGRCISNDDFDDADDIIEEKVKNGIEVGVYGVE